MALQDLTPIALYSIVPIFVHIHSYIGSLDVGLYSLNNMLLRTVACSAAPLSELNTYMHTGIHCNVTQLSSLVTLTADWCFLFFERMNPQKCLI